MLYAACHLLSYNHRIMQHHTFSYNAPEYQTGSYSILYVAMRLTASISVLHCLTFRNYASSHAVTGNKLRNNSKIVMPYLTVRTTECGIV